MTASASPKGAKRVKRGPVTASSLPPKTATIVVERFLPDSHQRGGRREHVARGGVAQLESILAAQGPGRYRVTCLDSLMHFLKHGAFAVEILSASRAVEFVPARTSSDYPRRGSAVTAACRQERRILRRVGGLEERLRAAALERATLRRDAALGRQRHFREKNRLLGVVEALEQQVGSLKEQLREAEATGAARHGAASGSLDALKAALAEERRSREEGEARVVEMIARLAMSPDPALHLETDEVVYADEAHPVPTPASAATEEGPRTVAAVEVDVPPDPAAVRTHIPVFAALAGVRNVVRPDPALLVKAPARRTITERLQAYLKDPHRRW